MFGFIKRYAWILVVIAGGAAYVAYFRVVPCSAPLLYRIGTFDTRFGITQADFLKATEKAETIWEGGIHKNLFEYNPKGDLVVNLIYDDRQKTTQQNQVLKADITKTNALAQSLKAEYTALENTYDMREAEYKTALNLFLQHQTSYNAEVQYWNSRGGAPKNEFTKITADKNSLLAEQKILEAKRVEVNSLADQINTFINKYNLLVKDANSNIDVINSTAGQEFEEGEYDPNTNTINIFEFSDSVKLKRVLAHELGHALGIGHNSNPKSIMYALNTAQNETLSPDDLTALRTVCNVK